MEAACGRGEIESCHSLALWHKGGLGTIAGDPTRVAGAFERGEALATAACEKGNALGCNFMGVLHEQGLAGLPKNQRKAAAFVQKACDGGDLDGCVNLGLFYKNGDGGLAKDEAKALALYEKSCEGGNGRGCYLAGSIYRAKGPRHDDAKAAAMFTRGCDRRHGDACSDLGYLHGTGESGVAKDVPKELSLYERACNLGSSLGCKNANVAKKDLERNTEAAEFRKKLAVGNDSHCGLVIEVKPPIARIQTMIGEQWLKIEQLYPKGKQNCRWVNGVYQDP
jgi:TPR repeat protein